MLQAEESDSEAESEILEGGADLSADQVYMMELDQKNAEIMLLRQQLVSCCCCLFACLLLQCLQMPCLTVDEESCTHTVTALLSVWRSSQH